MKRLIDRGILYWNTVRMLKLVQIRNQIAVRIKGKQEPKRYYMTRKPAKIRIVIPELDGDKEYLARFDKEALLRNRSLLLHEMHLMDGSWQVKEASHLWNYNLHYLEFLIPLAAEYHVTENEEYKKKYVEMLASWLEIAEENKDAYAPYTISMRIPNILIGMEMLGTIEEQLNEKIYESLYDQYKYLLHHLELALLANHYFENLKAIVIASILFGELDVYHKYFDLLLKQIEEQILPDGLHFERSLMYHKIILEDILRVYTVLRSSGHGMDAEKLLTAIKSMAEAIGSLERGVDHTPLFNDAGDNVSKPTAALLKVCKGICGDIDTEKKEFPNAGYYRLDNGNCTVLFDCGDIGAKYMAGHAHNDCLSFELCIDGKKIFTNSGTGQYQGSLRQFFRSTMAHNTMMVDDREQSELWGEHRAARRIDGVKAVIKGQRVAGQFRGFCGDRFRRQIQWQKDCLMIEDTVRCKDTDRHVARQFFHLAPGYRYEREGRSINVVNGDNERLVVIMLPENADMLLHTQGQITAYAREFGKYEKKQVLEVRMPFEKIVQLNVRIKMAGHSGLQS